MPNLAGVHGPLRLSRTLCDLHVQACGGEDQVSQFGRASGQAATPSASWTAAETRTATGTATETPQPSETSTLGGHCTSTPNSGSRAATADGDADANRRTREGRPQRGREGQLLGCSAMRERVLGGRDG